MSVRKCIFVAVCRGLVCAMIALLLVGLLAIGMRSCTPAPAVVGHFPAGFRPAGFGVIIAGNRAGCGCRPGAASPLFRDSHA